MRSYTFDVVVCGGGPSGLIAAAAAAKNGASVCVLEKNAFLGGLASGGLVAPISEFRKNGKLIVGGLPWEFVSELAELGGAELSYPNGNIPFDNELYKLAAARYLQKYGVSVFLNSCFSGCETVDENGEIIIRQVFCSHLCGGFSVSGRLFVDCTGDAVLAASAGAAFQPAGLLQPASLCMKIGGVDVDALENTRLCEHGTKYANTRIRGILEELRKNGERVPLFGGPWFQRDMTDGVVYANITRSAVDPEDPLECSRVESALREDALQLFRLLKENVEQFRESFIVQTGCTAGYRETRRIVGSHILTGTELLEHVLFEDTVACSAHPVDIHSPGDSGQQVRFLDRESCIPYRSLHTDRHGNLLVAGRCISADREAFASVRVQAPCMATGQAAGTAAAVCAAEDISVCSVSAKALRELLKSQGAVL